MRPVHVAQLVLLSLLWGGAYLFMRSSAPAFGAMPMVFLRMALASLLVLLPLTLWRSGFGPIRRHWREIAVFGLAFTALPFAGLGFAALSISAGLLAVLQSSAPMFAAIVAHLWLAERIGRWRALGLAIGFAGVLALVWGGVDFRPGGTGWALVALLVASLLWGIGGHYTRVRLSGLSPVAISVGTLAVAALALAPFAVATWPAEPPSRRAWLEVLALGVASSGLGFLLYYRLVRNIGAVRATSVTFLNPPVAMFAGTLYLGEPVTQQMLVGTAVILTGTGLALGLVGPRAGRAPTKAGAPRRTHR